MKKYDVVALGELLIDFTENGISNQGNPLLEANPGGAPCNLLAMLAKLEKKTAFIGKVGNDTFGKRLAEEVKSSGTDISNLLFDDDVHTTLAFVHTLDDGDREFSFYRNPGADMMLKADEVNAELIKSAKIFHFGTLSSTHEEVREATRYAVKTAKENGLLISFDPNLREPLWDSLDSARREIEYGIEMCDILKISDNEIEFMTETCDYDKGMAELLSKSGVKIAFATMGKEGSRAYYDGKICSVSGFKANTIETTGAGDTFGGCALNYLLERGIDGLKEDNLKELLTFANAAAAIVTTRKGALNVMPTRAEIEDFIAKNR
jgi:fructokinase